MPTTIDDVFSATEVKYNDAVAKANDLLTEITSIVDSLDIESNLGLTGHTISTEKQDISLPTLPTADSASMSAIQDLLNNFDESTITGNQYTSEFLTFLQAEVRSQIETESTGIRPADQDALFLRKQERNSRVFNDTAQQVITRTSRGFPMPTGMTIAALAEHGRRAEEAALDIARDTTALIAERASVNMRAMIAQGVEIERFLADFNDVIFNFYRTKAGILVDQFRAERDDYFRAIGVDLENVRTTVGVDTADAESYYKERDLEIRDAINQTKQSIQNVSARLQARTVEATSQITAYRDAATFYSTTAASAMSQISAMSLDNNNT